MRALHRWTIAAGLAALAGAAAAYVRSGDPEESGSEPSAGAPGSEANGPDAPSADAREALDAARARLRARAEQLHREIEDQEQPPSSG